MNERELMNGRQMLSGRRDETMLSISTAHLIMWMRTFWIYLHLTYWLSDIERNEIEICSCKHLISLLLWLTDSEHDFHDRFPKKNLKFFIKKKGYNSKFKGCAVSKPGTDISASELHQATWSSRKFSKRNFHWINTSRKKNERNE